MQILNLIFLNNSISVVSCKIFSYRHVNLYRIVNEKLKQLVIFQESGCSREDLKLWQEDMHWMLLLIGSYNFSRS